MAMTPCIQHYPDTHLSDEDRATVARILARQERPICTIYARILIAWRNAPKAEQPLWYKRAQDHIQICGCRVNKEPDHSWIFDNETVKEDELV